MTCHPQSQLRNGGLVITSKPRQDETSQVLPNVPTEPKASEWSDEHFDRSTQSRCLNLGMLEEAGLLGVKLRPWEPGLPLKATDS